MERVCPILVLAVAAGLLFLPAAHAQLSYDVTITNATRGQQFTPFIVVSHGAPSELFALGAPAQPGLVTLAEEGDIAPLVALYEARPDVRDVQTNGALLDPGASVTVTVAGMSAADRITLAAMLIPTNDAFVSLVDVAAPRPGKALVLRPVAYDAGSEIDDELCASIPGPFFPECGGPGGGGQPGNGEGFVHVHRGIHGVGDFAPIDRDWRNPVAEIVIRARPN